MTDDTEHPVTDGNGRRRLVGILGRTGEAIKVRGMFLHPRQAEAVFQDVAGLASFRFVITRENHRDAVRCEYVSASGETLNDDLQDRIRTALRFNADVQQVAELPADGPVLVDERTWD